jgi:hypothetical protein
MSNWFGRWFAYGVGRAAGRVLFGDENARERPPSREPVRAQTEAEILEDEKRYDEEARRLEEDAKAERAGKKAAGRP